MQTRLYTLQDYKKALDKLNNALIRDFATNKDSTPSKQKRDELRKKRKRKNK